MRILDGKKCSDIIKEEIKETIPKNVCLAVIQVGDDAASSIYVRNKEKACNYVGINSRVFKLDENTTEDKLIALIDILNKDNTVHGILVQLPLPKSIDENKIIQSISPEKDVDGFHVSNVGKLTIGANGFVPCTAYGIIELLKRNNIQIEGKHCVIVGRSNIVGKPVALELLHNNGTVTICHSKTKNLKQICKSADILVCAIGKPKFFNREYIADNAVVIDVGIHRQEDGTLCGDVDFEDVKDIVSAITPVPGGVGPMTIAMLMKNCANAAEYLI